MQIVYVHSHYASREVSCGMLTKVLLRQSILGPPFILAPKGPILPNTTHAFVNRGLYIYIIKFYIRVAGTQTLASKIPFLMEFQEQENGDDLKR